MARKSGDRFSDKARHQSKPVADILTIGHSNHPLAAFLKLLTDNGVKAVADVRSTPGSRRFPQFNQKRLEAALKENGIAYVFMGDALGGRPKDKGLWRGARPDYQRMAQTPAFKADVKQVRKTPGICLMCAEKEPLDCHRCLMVARSLTRDSVGHILADGSVEAHATTEQRLLKWAKLPADDLFQDAKGQLARAYDKRADWLWGIK